MDDKLVPKQYAVYDRTFMAFGSLMNACQHIITEKNKEEVAGWAWNFALKNTELLVEDLYQKSASESGELPF